MLEVSGLHVSYGQIVALRDVSMSVADGEFVGFIGPNGAGKSTLVGAVAGSRAVLRGSVALRGSRISGMTPEAIARLGVALVPEGRQIFTRLTVLENLKLGATIRRDRHQIAIDLESTFERFPALAKARAVLAGHLSGGQQQQLAIARALLSRPALLMLDEPSLGLAPQIVDGVFEWLAELHAKGTTVLLVEQEARRTVLTADRTYVLKQGRIVGEMRRGDIDVASADAGVSAVRQLVEAYLGVSSEEA